jgi:uncharacterized membrane protein YcaP (DUF421 family)
MQYADLFTLPPWEPVALSILQTVIIFCLVIGGLQIVGRRVFAQRGPQDLVIIVLVAEACDLGLTHEDAGFWGSVSSVITLLMLGYLTEKIPFLRHLLNEKPVILYQNGRLRREEMAKHMVGEDDLNEVARREGFVSYKNFETMILEGDGEISAIRPHQQNKGKKS